jgi:hypothetical protein
MGSHVPIISGGLGVVSVYLSRSVYCVPGEKKITGKRKKEYLVLGRELRGLLRF